jgi:KaiC/GvpD/RAD55 family RecA-like ATPase
MQTNGKAIDLPEEEIVIKQKTFPSCTLGELAVMDIKPRKPIIDPLIMEGASMEINGGTGIGKTWFTLEMLCSIATGEKFLGKYEVVNPRPVFYIDGEMPFDSIRDRVNMIMARYIYKYQVTKIPIHFSNPLLFDNNFIPKINDTKVTQTLIKDQIKRISDIHSSPIFVCFDNLSCLTDYKENDNDDWTSMLDMYTFLKHEGHSICHVHHVGKGGQQRGASRKHDALDTVIHLKRPEEYDASEGAVFNVRFDKHRHFAGEYARSFKCSIKVDDNNKVSWDISDYKDVASEELLTAYCSGLPDITYTKLEEEFGISKSTIGRTIKQCVKNGLYKIKMEEIYGDEWLNYDKLINKQTKKGVALSNTKEQTETTQEMPF